MATQYQIKCINKSDRYNIYQRIKSIGGTLSDGTSWKFSLADAIAGIEENKLAFYVSINFGTRVNVIVAKTPAGNKYLKTEADTTEKNNLLELPECK